MRRYLLIIAAVAVLVWAVLAIVLDSPSLKIGSSSSKEVAASPPCELSSPGRSAALAGTHVFASPAPDSATANPQSQVSFLGAVPSAVQGLSVVGSESGRHE